MSSSKSDGWSSIITGDSTTLHVEGKWDESVPLTEIHEGIVTHLASKLSKLKGIYKDLKSKPKASRDREEMIVRKIVTARLNYQRYMEMTRDILTRCGEFLKSRKDTPESRIAFIRNTQEYFSQAKNFVKMDISFKKLSPSLIKYIEPKGVDSPEVFRKKRELYRTIVGILGKEKSSQFTNGVGKTFRSRYMQQGRMFNRGFPDEWVSRFPLILRLILSEAPEEQRWPRLLLFIFSRYCSKNYVHQGFCPECYFSIIHTEDRMGGKLFCQACGKEIIWTYYINSRTINGLFSSFHADEISRMKDDIERIVRSHDEAYEGEIFDENFAAFFKEEPPPNEDGSDVSEDVEDTPLVDQRVSPKEGRGRPRVLGIKEAEFKIISFKDVLSKVETALKKIYTESEAVDLNLKYVYNTYKQEIQYFEGYITEDDKYPRGFFTKIENYVNYHFKLPPKEEVRTFSLDERGARTGTSRGMIIAALTELNFTKYLNQVTLICEKIWKYPKPNLSKHRDKIIYECVLQKEIFKRLCEKYKRKSNINQNHVLLYIMRRYGYTWNEGDFHINFQESTRDKQTKLMNEIFSIIDQK